MQADLDKIDLLFLCLNYKNRYFCNINHGKMKKALLSLIAILVCTRAIAVGASGFYQCSVQLNGYISTETGKAPNAYMWIPEGCSTVKAVMLAQQNMTEEALYKMESFRDRMSKLGVALVWVAPWFSYNWDPSTGAQQIFEEMMTGLAGQSGHPEVETAPIIPFGHSAQATFPWNFAAWNPDRTLCIISYHGDAPRTNLCGYGTANVEWGRTRNIDGIPGLMIEGEYEWWEARVNPALAFRMMYPETCISFLADTGRGHFDCGERTAEYIALFIQKALEQRLGADGSLKQLDPRNGWLAERWHPDGDIAPEHGSNFEYSAERPQPAPYSQYQGDPHDAFWYFDEQMARLTEERYAETAGKKTQYLGFEYNGSLVPHNEHAQGGMVAEFYPEKDGITLKIKAVYTDSSHSALSKDHGKAKPSIEVICGPVRKINDTTFRIYPYEAGWDNPRRAFSIWLCAVADADSEYKGAVQPIKISLPKDICEKVK